MASSGFTSLLWFLAVIALIPLALWLLKRTPMGGAAGHGVLRSVAAMPLSTSQRIVTVEVGQGESRRWLVLGITPHSITTLHTMEPQPEVPGLPGGPNAAEPPFAQLLSRLRARRGAPGGH
jgi:flagellar protein FliO/FliZ